MVTLLTSLTFELELNTPRFGESVHGIFQDFRCAARIRIRDAVVPDQTTHNGETEGNPGSLTGHFETAEWRPIMVDF